MTDAYIVVGLGQISRPVKVRPEHDERVRAGPLVLRGGGLRRLSLGLGLGTTDWKEYERETDGQDELQSSSRYIRQAHHCELPFDRAADAILFAKVPGFSGARQDESAQKTNHERAYEAGHKEVVREGGLKCDQVRKLPSQMAARINSEATNYEP